MKNVVTRSLVLAALSLAVLAETSAACSSTAVATSASGAAGVTLSLSSALAAAAVATRVVVTVSGPGITTPLSATLIRTATGYEGTIDAIPAGSGRTFDALLYDAAGVVTFSGQATGVTIDAGKTAMVQLLLQQLTPNDFANVAPFLTSLSASSLTAGPGDTVSLGVTAIDADGDALTYAWTASDGSFDDPTLATPVWTAGPGSASAAETISIVVSDPHGATAGATITIAAGSVVQTGSASVTASVNNWPQVTNLLATPSRVDAGDTTQLTATAADADGDALVYTWSTTCDGTLTESGGPDATLTLTALAASGTCAITTTVSDGRGGSSTGTLGIHTAPPVIVSPAVATPSR